MATVNSTSGDISTGLAGSCAMADPAPHHEKKSCSMASLSEPELLALRGQRIQLLQQLDDPLPEARFVAQVMAVHLPAPGSGVETLLLLLEDGHNIDQMDYADVASLTLLQML